MDVMELRRRIIEAMASGGAEVIKGTFTVPDTGTEYTINIGKTLTKYFYVIEMTDASKSNLMQSGYNANKTYARFGMYPLPSVENFTNNNKYYLSTRINPFTSEILATTASNAGINESTIKVPIDAISGSANAAYKGYSYNYIIISLDNI